MSRTVKIMASPLVQTLTGSFPFRVSDCSVPIAGLDHTQPNAVTEPQLYLQHLANSSASLDPLQQVFAD
jgi:hypothetical protein